MSGTTLLSSAPGKLVLLGEYVVLEGAPALVAAMERRAEVRCTRRAGGLWRISAPVLALHHIALQVSERGVLSWPDGMPQAFDRVAAVIAAAAVTARESGQSLPVCELELSTTAFFKGPDKLGLGSSAAISVALYGALCAAAQIPLPDRLRLITTVREAHRQAQGGRGSGVDVAASVTGGVLRYQNDSNGLRVAPLSRPRGVVLIPIWSGRSAQTGPRLDAFAALKQRDPTAYWACCEKLAILANAGSEFWALGNTAALLTIVDEYAVALEALGKLCGVDIVTAEHRAIAAQVRRAGAAYKPSGAGGGDLGVAVCGSSAMADKVLSRLRAQRLEAVPMDVSATGLHVQNV